MFFPAVVINFPHSNTEMVYGMIRRGPNKSNFLLLIKQPITCRIICVCRRVYIYKTYNVARYSTNAANINVFVDTL
jgi:hypothetical protein